MVLSLARLTARVQSNIGIIRGGVARGLSSTEIQGLIRQTGQAGLRRTDLLQGMRHVQGIAETGLRIQNVRKDLFPDPSRFEISRTPMLSEFSYEVRVGPEFLDDGSLNKKFLTVRSDRNLRPQDILQNAEDALAGAPEFGPYIRLRGDDRLTIVGGKRRG